jgi:hypothetical protein
MVRLLPGDEVLCARLPAPDPGDGQKRAPLTRCDALPRNSRDAGAHSRRRRPRQGPGSGMRRWSASPVAPQCAVVTRIPHGRKSVSLGKSVSRHRFSLRSERIGFVGRSRARKADLLALRPARRSAGPWPRRRRSRRASRGRRSRPPAARRSPSRTA